MSVTPRSSFSRLHQKAIENGHLQIEMTQRIRARIRLLLKEYNDSYDVQRDPNDRWIDHSDVQTEIVPMLCKLYGTETLELQERNPDGRGVDVAAFMEGAVAPKVFDVLQLWYDALEARRQRDFQAALNVLFQEEGFPWCFCERCLFQVDSQFLEIHVQAQLNELLQTHSHVGARQEFLEARNDLVAGDYKGAILNSCKAFESVLQGIVGRNGGQAGDLIKDLKKTGVLDVLPPNLHQPFEKTVLSSVPFLRNTLAGHGQGPAIVDVSRELAELCLHLAATLMLF